MKPGPGTSGRSWRDRKVPVWVIDALATPLSLAGLLFVLSAWWVPLRISLDGAGTTGVVVDKYVLKGGESPDTEHLRYAFVIAKRDYNGSSEMGRVEYARAKIGDAIAIQYVAADPSVNRPSSAPAVTGTQVEVTALGLVWFGVLGPYWWLSARKSARFAAPSS